jgi:hypothetical protein
MLRLKRCTLDDLWKMTEASLNVISYSFIFLQLFYPIRQQPPIVTSSNGYAAATISVSFFHLFWIYLSSPSPNPLFFLEYDSPRRSPCHSLTTDSSYRQALKGFLCTATINQEELELNTGTQINLRGKLAQKIILEWTCISKQILIYIFVNQQLGKRKINY